MQKFEYKILQGRKFDIQKEINDYAQEGWDVAFFIRAGEDKIGVHTYIFAALLKRPRW